MRGGANFSSFATGKFAMRALTQSLAREFGPQGVHVAHAIIDGIIDIPRTKEWKVDKPDGKISPEAVSGSCPVFLVSPFCLDFVACIVGSRLWRLFIVMGVGDEC